MALAATFTNPKGGQVALRNTGSIFVTIATGGATYTSASGGMSADLAAILSGASTGGISASDVVDITGMATTGESAVFTFSTGTTWTFKIFAGTTEASDGAFTKTFKCIIWLAGGSLK